MPPKTKITKEMILDSALKMVRADGFDSINARKLAERLDCSTQPIFSNYPSMEALKEDILRYASSVYTEFITTDMQKNEYPPYKAMGMAYIRFAKEEKELFKLLFMRSRETDDEEGSSEDFELAVSLIQKNLGISREKARLFQLEMWIYVHGMATMIATSYFELDKDMISNILTDAYEGLKKRHLTEG